MSENIIANGYIHGQEMSFNAEDISYQGQVTQSENVKEALDNLQIQVNNKVNDGDFSEVAFSGEYEDIKNSPSIPKRISDLEDGSNYALLDTTKLQNYLTSDKLYTKDDIDNLLNHLNKPIYMIVDKLPAIEDALSSVIYLLERPVSLTNSKYQKVMFVNNNWEYFTESDNGTAEIQIDQDVEENKESQNPVSTSAVYQYVNKKIPDIEIIETVEQGKNNPVTSNGIYEFVINELPQTKFADVAYSGDYYDLKNIPEEQILRKATTTSLGVVQIDGETIKINDDGVISVALSKAEEVYF